MPGAAPSKNLAPERPGALHRRSIVRYVCTGAETAFPATGPSRQEMAGAANPLGRIQIGEPPMSWLLVLAWIVLLGALAIFAQQAFGFNLDAAARHLMALPLPEQSDGRRRRPNGGIPGWGVSVAIGSAGAAKQSRQRPADESRSHALVDRAGRSGPARLRQRGGKSRQERTRASDRIASQKAFRRRRTGRLSPEPKRERRSAPAAGRSSAAPACASKAAWRR